MGEEDEEEEVEGGKRRKGGRCGLRFAHSVEIKEQRHLADKQAGTPGMSVCASVCAGLHLYSGLM